MRTGAIFSSISLIIEKLVQKRQELLVPKVPSSWYLFFNAFTPGGVGECGTEGQRNRLTA